MAEWHLSQSCGLKVEITYVVLLSPAVADSSALRSSKLLAATKRYTLFKQNKNTTNRQ